MIKLFMSRTEDKFRMGHPPFKGCAEVLAITRNKETSDPRKTGYARAVEKAKQLAKKHGTVYVDRYTGRGMHPVWIVWQKVTNFESPKIEGAVMRIDLNTLDERAPMTIIEGKNETREVAAGSGG